ncbi:PD-(D/E)XK nuclease family protein [Chloroflexota bacterium]
MRWSFSAHGTFRRCPRQWFFRQVYANSRANDPTRREAYRLSKLESIPAWRGKLVDTIISETIIPSISLKQPCNASEVKQKADDLFTLQRAERTMPNAAVSFFEVEYGLPLTEEIFDQALTDVRTALDNFFEAEQVWQIIEKADAIIPQRALSFKHGDTSVMVVPDLITFQSNESPYVLDWKVNRYPMRDYWLQLVTGAIAITKCNPHRDWPSGCTLYDPNQVKLYEIQLLSGDVRLHNASEYDIHEAQDFISISATEMSLAVDGNDPKNPLPKDYQAASEPRTCQMCSYRKLCWEGDE